MKDDAEPGGDLRNRTKEFAVRIGKLYTSLPKAHPAQTYGLQVLRSGASVGAHYREAIRAKSEPDYVSKLQGAIQELDESAYWMQLLVESKIVPEGKLAPLRQEANELIAILTTIVVKVKRRMSG